MPKPWRLLPLPLCAAFALAGCAAEGSYPSLAVRPAELAGTDEEERRPAALPEDAAVAAEIARLSAEARRGGAAFDAARGPAETAVGRAGAAGSDSWVEAQQAVSRLEAARAPTTRALADLDALALERARSGTLAAEDRQRLEAAVAELQALANAQADALRRLEARLRPR